MSRLIILSCGLILTFSDAPRFILCSSRTNPEGIPKACGNYFLQIYRALCSFYPPFIFPYYSPHPPNFLPSCSQLPLIILPTSSQKQESVWGASDNPQKTRFSYTCVSSFFNPFILLLSVLTVPAALLRMRGMSASSMPIWKRIRKNML